jgi:hypothetical protein
VTQKIFEKSIIQTLKNIPYVEGNTPVILVHGSQVLEKLCCGM